MMRNSIYVVQAILFFMLPSTAVFAQGKTLFEELQQIRSEKADDVILELESRKEKLLEVFRANPEGYLSGYFQPEGLAEHAKDLFSAITIILKSEAAAGRTESRYLSISNSLWVNNPFDLNAEAKALFNVRPGSYSSDAAKIPSLRALHNAKENIQKHLTPYLSRDSSELLDRLRYDIHNLEIYEKDRVLETAVMNVVEAWNDAHPGVVMIFSGCRENQLSCDVYVVIPGAGPAPKE